MVYVKDQQGTTKVNEQDFKSRRSANAYCKKETTVFKDLILSVYSDGYPVAHWKQGRLLYSK